MDFKNICESISYTSCVVSVEKTKDGYGEIRIVEGNEKYLNSFKGGEKSKFVSNSLYTKYINKNLNFENYAYRCAVKKELLHSYAFPENYGAWFHMLYIPLEYEEDNLSYCLYIMDINNEFDPGKLSNAHNDIANRVLKTTLQLSNTNNFKKSINKVINDIREMCKASFCCILLLNEIDDELTVLAESRDINSDRLEMRYYMDDNFHNVVKTWDNTIGDSDCIIIEDEKTLLYIKDKNPLWYNTIIKNKIKSLVLFRLKSRNNLLGYIWVSNFIIDDIIKIKETLEITSFILGSEIGNYLLVNKLTELSTLDLLTGVLNRNEMNNYINKIIEDDKEYNLGIIFMDINGLKKVNDSKGHLAGDALIKRASNTLKSIFSDGEIFRAGGDEFVVIIHDTCEEELIEYKKKIKQTATLNNVSLAVGYSININHKELLHSFKEADKNMYLDKREYYLEKI